MSKKSGPDKAPAEDAIKDIRRATRRHFSAEDKIRIVLEGLRGEDSISELCRREGIASSMYYGWSKEFLEAGKKRLAGDTARAATSDEVKDLRRETQALKEVVADLTLENRLLKKRMARPNQFRLFLHAGKDGTGVSRPRKKDASSGLHSRVSGCSRRAAGTSGFSAKPNTSQSSRKPARSGVILTRFSSATRGVRSVVTFSRTTCLCTIPLCLTSSAKAAGTMSVSFVRYTAVPFMRSGAPG